MPNYELPAPVREAAARFTAAISDVRDASRAATESLRRLAAVAAQDVTATAEYQDLEEKAATGFRAGRGGPEVQQLQRRVDDGELSWREIRDGTADPEATRMFRENQGAIMDTVEQIRRESAPEPDPDDGPDDGPDEDGPTSVYDY